MNILKKLLEYRRQRNSSDGVDISLETEKDSSGEKNNAIITIRKASTIPDVTPRPTTIKVVISNGGTDKIRVARVKDGIEVTF